VKRIRASSKSICFYFQVHQPLRLNNFNYFDINSGKPYFTDENKKILKKVADKCYYPTNDTILYLLKHYPEFKCSYSISGVMLDQCELYEPKLLESFKKLVATKKVELLSETYYHSLAYLYSKNEFLDQILLHRKRIWELFRKRPTVFRNTELIYNNAIAEFARQLGFKTILAEGWEKYLHWRSPNFLYSAQPEEPGMTHKELLLRKRFTDQITPRINLLMKNYKLSDDIAFRFGDRKWSGFPLTAEKFADWVLKAPGETINLFMDYETFGEHQWKETGIFEFMKMLPKELLKRGIGFRTPSETASQLKPQAEISIPHLLSWADVERDLSAWTQNRMQQEALKKVYEIRTLLKRIEKHCLDKNKFTEMERTWRYLQTSDHFYYMSTKFWSDGDIHAYFSPYDSPYDAYINYMNVINDFKQKLMLLR